MQIGQKFRVFPVTLILFTCNLYFCNVQYGMYTFLFIHIQLVFIFQYNYIMQVDAINKQTVMQDLSYYILNYYSVTDEAMKCITNEKIEDLLSIPVTKTKKKI